MADSGRTDVGSQQPRATRHGVGRVLILVYGVFAVSASARALVQIATRFEDAPLAYTLSAFAAGVYVVATIALSRSSRRAHLIAVSACTTELVGVLSVGLASRLDPAAFPDATVWSGFGRGYGYVPLVLPVLGLFWLWQTRPTRSPSADSGQDH